MVLSINSLKAFSVNFMLNLKKKKKKINVSGDDEYTWNPIQSIITYLSNGIFELAFIKAGLTLF